jgi:hypothetical protein
VLGPFEAVHMRSVAQSEDGTTLITVTKKKMVLDASLALCC